MRALSVADVVRSASTLCRGSTGTNVVAGGLLPPPAHDNGHGEKVIAARGAIGRLRED